MFKTATPVCALAGGDGCGGTLQALAASPLPPSHTTSTKAPSAEQADSFGSRAALAPRVAYGSAQPHTQAGASPSGMHAHDQHAQPSTMGHGAVSGVRLPQPASYPPPPCSRSSTPSAWDFIQCAQPMPGSDQDEEEAGGSSYGEPVAHAEGARPGVRASSCMHARRASARPVHHDM